MASGAQVPALQLTADPSMGGLSDDADDTVDAARNVARPQPERQAIEAPGDRHGSGAASRDKPRSSGPGGAQNACATDRGCARGDQ